MTMLLFLLTQLSSSDGLSKEGEVAKQAESAINPAEQGRLPDEAFGNLFLRREMVYSGGRYNNATIPYLLMLPTKIEPDQKYPLIIWLHGHGPVEYSHEKLGTLNWLEQLMEVDRETAVKNFYVLAPCCFDRAPWYSEFGDPAKRYPDGKGDEMLTLASEMIDHAIRHNSSIDTSRITATGVSSGGTACWELALRNPGLLAAIAPIASAGGDITRLHLLEGTSVWAFHNEFDHITSINGVRETIRACRNHDIHATLTEFRKSEHDAWTDAFRQCDLLKWLLAQEQGVSPYLNAARYELVTYYWTKRAGVAVAAIVVLLAVYNELRRRKEYSADNLDPHEAAES